ncbi:MAG: hypothetical protein KGV57_05035 [Fusobacterium sp.]|nr:hypothetical protein [Fusobacterium sp.]
MYKKILIFITLGVLFISCSKKWPYTSREDKVKLCTQSMNGDERAGIELEEILGELRYRALSGDRKAKKELNEFDEVTAEIFKKAFLLN